MKLRSGKIIGLAAAVTLNARVLRSGKEISVALVILKASTATNITGEVAHRARFAAETRFRQMLPWEDVLLWNSEEEKEELQQRWPRMNFEEIEIAD